MEQLIKVIIADDKAQWRRAIRLELETCKERNFIVEEAINGIDLLNKMIHFPANVILLDLDMPEMDGSEALDRLLILYPDIGVIIISFHGDPLLREDFIRRGARGFASKDEITGNIDELPSMIKKAAIGKNVIRNFEKPVVTLTEKQKDVVQLKADGKSTKEIGDTLGMTTNGVTRQIRNIMRKMGFDSISMWSKSISKAGFEFLRRPK